MKKIRFSKNRIEQRNEIQTDGKKKNKSRLIMVGFILFTMIFSAIAISFFYRTESPANTAGNEIKYQDFKFRDAGGYWISNINGADYEFEYSPSEVENIVSVSLVSGDFNQKLYILFDPSEFNENSQELLRLKVFLLRFSQSVNLACIREEGCGNLPIVNCKGSSKAVYLSIGENMNIYKEDNCFVLNSKKGMELFVINRFMYGLLGVIDGEEKN